MTKSLARIAVLIPCYNEAAAIGTLRKTGKGKYFAQYSIGPKKRAGTTLYTCTTEEEAQRRRLAIARLTATLGTPSARAAAVKEPRSVTCAKAAISEASHILSHFEPRDSAGSPLLYP